MKKNRPSKRKKQTSQENSTKSSTIIGIISLLFSLVAIIVSMTSFFLPLIRTRLVIENQAKIYSLRRRGIPAVFRAATGQGAPAVQRDDTLPVLSVF